MSYWPPVENRRKTWETQISKDVELLVDVEFSVSFEKASMSRSWEGPELVIFAPSTVSWSR